jgi:hypothetical protein
LVLSVGSCSAEENREEVSETISGPLLQPNQMNSSLRNIQRTYPEEPHEQHHEGTVASIPGVDEL